MHKSRQSPSAAQLRSQAEERLARDKSVASRQLSSLETVQLVHELRVHQIELELQIAALRESREETEAALALYADLYDSAPIAYFTLSSDGEIRRANLAAARLFGTEPARLKGQRFGLFVSLSTRADFNSFRERVRAQKSKQSCEVVLEKPGQPPMVVALEGVLTPDETECRVVVMDLTERRQSEAAQARLAAIVETANDAIMSMSLSGIIESWNPGAERLFGYRAAEIIGRPVSLLTPADRQEKLALVIADLALGARVDHYETIRLRKDGSRVEVELTVSLIRDASGQITGASSIVHDVTQRRKMQEQLRLLEASVAHLRDMVVIIEGEKHDEASLRIVFVNAAFERKTGYTRAEVLGRAPSFLWGPKTSEEVLNKIRAAGRAQEPVRAELVNYTKSGGEFWGEIDIVPILAPDSKHTHWVSIHRDVTERRALESQLRQAQKMEVIGQLAGGVAHDFNNLLMAMMLNLDLLRDTLPVLDPDSPLHNLDLLTKRAKTLTNQLLIFARQQHVQLHALELNAALNNVLEMMQRLLGEQIELQVERGPGALWVEADLGLLDLVVINLCLNARDAMPSGGKLTVATALVEIDAERALEHVESRPGQFVCLQVTDTGCGMSPEILQHLFEPFFTTKEPGKGTGLGLASVYGIVHQHKGWVSVASTPRTGTTFRVYLPFLMGVKDAMPARPLTPPRPGGNETILLVEDEEMVRRLATKILKRLGYQVLAAATASEALRLWAKHADEISLLLTDMVMPEGTTGLQLAEKLRRAKASLKIVLMSGYSSEIVNNDVPHDGIDAFVTKPFDLETLSTTIRQLLDEDGARERA